MQCGCLKNIACLCRWLSCAPVKKGMVGWAGLLISCQVGCDVRCLRWSNSNMRLCSFGSCSGMSSLLWWSECVYICSYGSSRAGVLILLSSVMVSLMLPYSCRNPKSRYQEHIRYIKNNDPRSAYALHILNNRHEYGNINDTMTLLKHFNFYICTVHSWY